MIITPVQQSFWDWRAAGNFIFGGSGSGLILWAAAGYALGLGGPLPLLVGAAMIALGLTLVWFEIGRPERFINVLRNPRTSWMSREAWVALALLPLCFGALLPATWFIAAPLMLLAALFVYCQGRILTASTGVALWRRRKTTWITVITGLSEGLALFFILAQFTSDLPTDTGMVLQSGMLIMIVFRALGWRIWYAALAGSAPKDAHTQLSRFEKPFLLAGHVLPLVLIAAAWMIAPLAALFHVITGVAVVFMGWRLKYLLITRAGHLQGFAIRHTPARGGGLAGPGVKPGWN